MRLRIPPPRWLINWAISQADHNPIPDITHDDGSLYMERGTIFRCEWMWIRVHITYRSDKDPHRHDHPWRNISWILVNGYIEDMPTGRVKRIPGEIIFRGLKSQHRLDLYTVMRSDGKPSEIFGMAPCVSLFITGRWLQTWGFFVDGVKVPWREYLKNRAQFVD